MMADAAGMGVASLAIGQATFAYTAFLPSLREVRRAEPGDPLMRGDVLLGQVAAGSVTLSVGGLLSWMTQSRIPLWTSIAIGAIMAALYQYALTNQRAEVPE